MGNRIAGTRGFTLIELIAVLSIISIMLFFSIPRLSDDSQSGDIKAVSRWILINVRELKSKAADERRTYILQAEMDANAFTITREQAGEDDLESTPIKTYALPAGIELVDVEFPGKGVIAAGKVPIRFYAKGYSDKALIHIRDNENNLHSFLIESFLSQTQISDERIDFR